MASYLDGADAPKPSTPSKGGSYLADGEGFVPRADTPVKDKQRRNPQKELASAVKRLSKLEASGQLKGKDLERLQDLKRQNALNQVMPTEDIGTRSPEKAVAKGLGKALDYLGRPGQTVMSGLAEFARGGSDPTRVGEIATAAKEGFQGKRHETFGGIIEENLGIDIPTAAQIPLDLITGVALDPISYATLGTSQAAKQGLQVTEKTLGAAKAGEVATKGTKVLTEAERAAVAANTTPKVMAALDKGAKGGLKLGGRTVPGLSSANVRKGAEATKLPKLGRAAAASKPAQFAASVFIPRAAIKAKYGAETADKINNARIAYRAGQNVAIEDDLARIMAAARQSGATHDELVDLGRTLDVGSASLAAPLPNHLIPLRDTLIDVRDKFTRAQIEAGVLADDAIHITDEYLPRYLTDEGKKFFDIDDASQTPIRAGATSLKAADSKNLTGRTFGKEKAAADLLDDAGKPLFETNPVAAVGRRAVEAHQDVAKRTFLTRLSDDLPDQFTRIDEEATFLDDGTKITRTTPYPNDWVVINAGRAGKFAAPKEIAEEVKKVIAMTVNDESLRASLKALDQWMALWKSYATVPLPFGWGFHMRNGMGNVANNYLAGGVNIPDYKKALDLQIAVSKGKKAGDVLAHLDDTKPLWKGGPTEKGLIQEARKHGTIGEGFFDVDLAADAMPKPRLRDVVKHPVQNKGALNPLSTDNLLIRSGRTAGSAVEDNARLAHFIAKRKELGSAEAAAASVRKYLFDYSDLTATEQNIIKRVSAFYTFTRKNLPVQLEALVKTPGKFSAYEHVREALMADAPDTGGLEPDYLLRGAGTPLPQGITDALAAVPGLGYTKGDPAMLDLGGLLPVGNAVDTLTPLMNLAAEVVPGADEFRHEEGFKAALGEALQNTLVGGAAGATVSGTEAALGQTLFSGRRLEGETDTPYALLPVAGDTIDKAKLHIIEQNLPLLAKISSTIPRGEKANQGSGRRRLSTATGLRVTQLNDATRDAEALRRLDIIAEFIARLKDQGVRAPGSN